MTEPLDHVTEQMVFQNLRVQMSGRTTPLIRPLLGLVQRRYDTETTSEVRSWIESAWIESA